MRRRNPWRSAGHIYAIIANRRQLGLTTREAIAAGLAAEAVTDVIVSIQVAVEENLGSHRRKQRLKFIRLRLTESPARLKQLLWPTVYPFERERLAWPFFQGHPKKLGVSES